MKFLEHSASIRGELQRLFRKGSQRKVILVAFVGADAPHLLPSWKGVELYCWPNAGGTNPNALERLEELGAVIHFADRLHMKLYWVKGRGAVVGSANLTDNALGVGKLHEAAVILRRTELVGVDKIIARIKPNSMTGTALKRLFVEHDRFYREIGFTPARSRSTKQRSFLDWYRNRSQDWRLTWWDDGSEAADSVLDQLEAEEGTREYECYMGFSPGNCPGRDKWILTYKIGRGGRIGNPDWMYIDRVYRMSAKEAADTEYPVEAFQLKPLTTAPPFDLKEGEFATVFRRVVSEDPFWSKKKTTSLRKWLPGEVFLKKLAEAMAHQG